MRNFSSRTNCFRYPMRLGVEWKSFKELLQVKSPFKMNLKFTQNELSAHTHNTRHREIYNKKLIFKKGTKRSLMLAQHASSNYLI